MKTILALRSLLFLSTAVVIGCGTESTSPAGTDGSGGDGEFFASGKGLRKLYATEFAAAGIGQHYVGDLTLSNDGYVHAIYAYGLNGVLGAPGTFTNYRTKVSVAGGDTVALAIPTVLRNVNLSTVTVGCAGFGLVPYTDVLAYGNNGVIEGTPN